MTGERFSPGIILTYLFIFKNKKIIKSFAIVHYKLPIDVIEHRAGHWATATTAVATI